MISSFLRFIPSFATARSSSDYRHGTALFGASKRLRRKRRANAAGLDGLVVWEQHRLEEGRCWRIPYQGLAFYEEKHNCGAFSTELEIDYIRHSSVFCSFFFSVLLALSQGVD